MCIAPVEEPGESPVDKVSAITCSPEVTVLGKYVDGLHVSVTGDFLPEAYKVLSEARSFLRASPHGLREIDSIPGVPGGPLVLITEAEDERSFVLKNGAIRRLTLTFRGCRPRMRIQFRACTLYERGLQGAEEIVEAVGGFFLESGFCHKVSRFDYAVDFQCREWRWPESLDCISRARKRSTDEEAGRITGKTFGKSSGKKSPALQVQIYDKTFEIRKFGKEWMAERWATKEAYDPELPVIRVEARFNRDFLRGFKLEDPNTSEVRGIDTIAGLKTTTGDLARYVVGDGGVKPWFRIASPESRGRKADRRPAAPWWEKIAEAFLEGEPETGRVRVHGTGSIPSFRRDRFMCFTYAVKLAAQKRLREGDPATDPKRFVAPVLMRELPEWLKDKGLGSWDEAVDLEEAKILSSGVVPFGSYLEDVRPVGLNLVA